MHIKLNVILWNVNGETVYIYFKYYLAVPRTNLNYILKKYEISYYICVAILAPYFLLCRVRKRNRGLFDSLKFENDWPKLDISLCGFVAIYSFTKFQLLALALQILLVWSAVDEIFCFSFSTFSQSMPEIGSSIVSFYKQRGSN